MNVLLDISLSTLSVAGAENKRGFSRVIDQYIVGLLDNSEINLSTFSLSEDIYAQEFLKQSPLATKSHYALSTTQKLFGPTFSWLNTTIPNAGSVIKKPLRVVRRSLIEVNKCFKLFFDPIDKKTVHWADILHVPFNPLPKFERHDRHPVSFITLFDMIPVMFPQFVPASFQKKFEQILNSIDANTHIMAISESTKRDLVAYRSDIEPSRIHVTPLAAIDTFQPTSNAETNQTVLRKYGIPVECSYILTVTRLDPNKNISTLIMAFDMARKRLKRNDLKLVLVGGIGTNSFDETKRVNRLISNTSDVIWVQFVSDEDLPALYSSATVFAFPSFYEGFGLPVLEAMQCGAPVLTSSTSSLPEVAGPAGMYIDPHDVNGWADALCLLCQDETLRQKMSSMSMAHASTFSWRRTIDLTIAAYQSALLTV